jgi:hypothetical protein
LTFEIVTDLSERRVCCSWLRDDDDITTASEVVAGDELAEAALDAVADDRGANAAADGEADAGLLEVVWSMCNVQQRPTDAASAAHHTVEVGTST